MPSSSSVILLPSTSAHFSACNRQAAVVEQKRNIGRRLHPRGRGWPGAASAFGGNEPQVQHPGHAMENWQNEPECGVYKWTRAIFTKRSQPVKTPRDQQVICKARFTQHHGGALTRAEGRNFGPQVQVVFLQIGSGRATPCPAPRTGRVGWIVKTNLSVAM
jgi:hypothetical protein